MDKLIEILINNGYNLIIIFLICVIIFLIANADKVSILLFFILEPFAKFFSFAKKKQLSAIVSGTITSSVKNQGLKSNIIPSNLKVIWIDKENPETFIKNSQIIVRIKQSSNPHENLVTAVSEYVNNGLLHNVRRYLNQDVMSASSILMTRKVIQEANKNSLDYLDEKYIIPKMNNNAELKDIYNNLVKIDHNGMFINILLNEFHKAGMSIYGEIPDPELIAESKEFMNYLYRIAARYSSETSELCFNRDYFKTAIFLTASTKTLIRSGISPFIKAAKQQLSEGVQTLYIFGLGSKIDIAEQISNELDTDFRIGKIEKHAYKHINENGKRIPGVLYECEIYKEDIIKDT